MQLWYKGNHESTSANLTECVMHTELTYVIMGHFAVCLVKIELSFLVLNVRITLQDFCVLYTFLCTVYVFLFKIIITLD